MSDPILPGNNKEERTRKKQEHLDNTETKLSDLTGAGDMRSGRREALKKKQNETKTTPSSGTDSSLKGKNKSKLTPATGGGNTPPPMEEKSKPGIGASAGGTNKAGDAAGKAGDAAGKAGDAAGKAGDAAGKAGDAASSAAGSASLVKPVLNEGKAMKNAVADGDTAEAAAAGTRLAAIGAATYFGGAQAGSLTAKLINTKIGRKLTKYIGKTADVSMKLMVTGVVSAIALVIVAILMFVSLMSAAAGVLVASEDEDPVQKCLTGVTDRTDLSTVQKQNDAGQIISLAYQNGFAGNAAIVAVMAALTESGMDKNAKPDKIVDGTLPPMIPAGLFQMEPWLWSRQSWPAGTTVGSEDYLNPAYLNAALQNIMDTKYVANKFYERMQTDPLLASGKWKKLDPWKVAAIAMRNADDPNGLTYKVNYDRARTDVLWYTRNIPGIQNGWTDISSNSPPLNVISNACGTLLTKVDIESVPGSYTLNLKSGTKSVYTDGTKAYPNIDIVLSRAYAVVGHASLACDDGMCLSLCDHLAGWIWGYSNSGYFSAKVHWQTAVQSGIAHPGDFNPPVGALLFWDTSAYGHVATYVGNGYVVSNLRGSLGNNVYLMPADWWTGRYPYLGWADPVFRGAKIPGTGL